MMDVDSFKPVNDTYGHDAGDIVLKQIADLLNEHFEAPYIPARLGGEEFGVYFGELDITVAYKKLEKFRLELEALSIDLGDTSISCTMSIGLAHQIAPNLDELLNVADKFLYDAKHTGKNRIVFC
jgi:diguanylate cyclase (GGDEF)-like protein